MCVYTSIYIYTYTHYILVDYGIPTMWPAFALGLGTSNNALSPEGFRVQGKYGCYKAFISLSDGTHFAAACIGEDLS